MDQVTSSHFTHRMPVHGKRTERCSGCGKLFVPLDLTNGVCIWCQYDANPVEYCRKHPEPGILTEEQEEFRAEMRAIRKEFGRKRKNESKRHKYYERKRATQ